MEYTEGITEGRQPTLSSGEVRDLAVSTLGLGVAFAILFFAPRNDVQSFLLSVEVVPAVIASTALVALAFIPHAMAHRVTARSMDAYAEYEMWVPGIVLAVLTSLLGVVFAAPGGTRMHLGKGERFGLSETDLTPKVIGYTSVIGPLISISLAILFALIALSVAGPELYGVNLLVMASRINGYLAVFTLLPFYPLDGYKVLRWSTWMWGLTMLLGILTFFVGPV